MAYKSRCLPENFLKTARRFRARIFQTHWRWKFFWRIKLRRRQPWRQARCVQSRPCRKFRRWNLYWRARAELSHSDFWITASLRRQSEAWRIGSAWRHSFASRLELASTQKFFAATERESWTQSLSSSAQIYSTRKISWRLSTTRTPRSCW